MKEEKEMPEKPEDGAYINVSTLHAFYNCYNQSTVHNVGFLNILYKLVATSFGYAHINIDNSYYPNIGRYRENKFLC